MRKRKYLRFLAVAMATAMTVLTAAPAVVQAKEELREHGNGFETVSDKWFTSNGDWNHNYAPNAIDPTVFFDENDELYMVYGSWSGGLFILPLDRETGEVIYPGQDDTEKTSGNFTDRYFGTHIAGGKHQSGEGPFIVYDRKTGYYYLYETYGGLSTYGGYNMRLFRAENVYGPYLDAAGNNAADNGKSAASGYNDKYGIKLIGNYQFDGQPGYFAAGHNSVLYEEDGSRYLVYHQRFDEKEKGHLAHEVRIHQQFINEDGWPVTAVYEYRGEKIAHYDDSLITGTYRLIGHGTETSKELLPTKTVELKEDGTITGDESGTWEKKTGAEYDYVTIKIGSVTYKGVFLKQQDESEKKSSVMTFTAIGDNNESLWASKTDQSAKEEPDGEEGGSGRIMVHDPSIIKANDGNYYIFGSHLASAKSSDLVHWEQITGDADTFAWKTDSIYGDILTNLAGSFAWAGYNDGDVTGDHVGVWAPHIVWNPYYKNADKTEGAYMDYYCTSSTWRRSCIGYAVSKEPAGGYQYADTVIFSGFTRNGAVDGGGSRNTKWDNDYLNLTRLIDHYQNVYYVTYDKNVGQLADAGASVEGEMERQKAKKGEGVLVAACAYTVQGYEFEGWNTKADGTGYNWDEENVMDVESDITLYAQWKKNEPDSPDTPDQPGAPGQPAVQKPSGKTETTQTKPASSFCAGAQYKDAKTNAVYEVNAAGDVPKVTYVRSLVKKGTVKIPGTVVLDGKTCLITEIAAGAFAKDTGLTSVTIGNQIVRIGNKAFYGCTKLKKAVLGKNVTTIGKQAFAGDKALKNISIKSVVLKKAGSKAFGGIHAKAVIRVPGKQLRKYEKLLKKKGLPKTVRIR